MPFTMYYKFDLYFFFKLIIRGLIQLKGQACLHTRFIFYGTHLII